MPHKKASGAEKEAKQHLISVGLYGKSVSIISNAFRLTTIIRNYAEKEVFKEYNLSFSGFVVMWVLWVWDDMETAKLAKDAGIAKSTLTGILKTLEKHKYCQRVEHKSDARRVVVRISETGKKLMEEVFTKYHQIEDLAISELSECEFENTRDGLRAMLHTLEKNKAVNQE